jgi:GNAT superfamily N-acetyltransferase
MDVHSVAMHLDLHPSSPALRVATHDDVPAIRALIADSVRGLSAGFYTPAQAESGLRHVFGVDTKLIDDGTYYVVPAPDGIAAAGGWSARRTLFGGDQMKDASDPRLDPARDPARIRAFFVHPSWARRGFGRLLFERCRLDARAAGFSWFELMATLPGEPLYAALGFQVTERVPVSLPDGLTLPCAVMSRPID